MNKKLPVALAVVFAAAMGFRSLTASSGSSPQFTRDNRLVLPKDYRDWIFLASGLGMTYGTPETARGTPETARQQNFDNVFVHPAAYREFVRTGRWPDHTVFVLEVRAAAEKGSINTAGHYQTGVLSIEAEVKDRTRFPDGEWGYFAFGSKADPAAPLPKAQGCQACHSQNGAVESTFVQFYPTLLPIARAKGTLKALPAESH